MKQHAEHMSGVWWHPDAPDQTCYGTLTFDARGGGRLILTEQPSPSGGAPGHLPQLRDEPMRGVARCQPVSLIGCTTVHVDDAPSGRTSHISARDVIVGTSTGSPEALAVTCASAVIPQLTAWMEHRSPHSVGISTWGRDSGHVDVVSPVLAHGRARTAAEGPGARAASPRRPLISAAPDVVVDADGHPTAQIRVTVSEDRGLTLAEARRHLLAVQELSCLVTLSPPTPIWLLAALPGDEDAPSSQRVEWCWRQESSADRARTPAPEGLLAPASRAPIADLLPKWWRLRDQHRAGLELMLDALKAPHSSPELNLLVLVASAEALFTTVSDTTPHQRKDSTLRMKLLHLARRVDADTASIAGITVEEWAELTARARNTFTHSSRMEAPPTTVGTLARLTAHVVVMNVLDELGIAPEERPASLPSSPMLHLLTGGH